MKVRFIEKIKLRFELIKIYWYGLKVNLEMFRNRNFYKELDKVIEAERKDNLFKA